MNNKQDFFKTQTCVLRVNIHCDGCRSKVKKILQKIDGVYTVSIDAGQGKVTVTGTVDPSTLIKKLEKNGKHAELWGPPPSSKGGSNHQFMNQFKNLSFDAGGKMVKDNKSHKGGGGGKDQQPQQVLHQQQIQQQVLQQQQQQLMQLQQQMNKGGKDFKMPALKDAKSVKFSMPEDEFDEEFDEFDDDEYDDDEFDDEEFDDDVVYAKHGHGHQQPLSKNVPVMGNVHVPKGGSGGGGGEKKGKSGGGGGGGDGKKKGGSGGGGGMAGLIKGMLGGGKSVSKKGKNEKKDGKNGGKDKGGLKGGGGKHGNEGKKGEGKMGKEEILKGGPTKGGGQNGKSKGNVNVNGGKNKGGGGGGFKEIDGMSNHNKSGGPNMSMMAQMGNYPMGSNNIPSIPSLPAGPQPMMNGGGGNGYYPGTGPGPAGFNNPQQQQYMAMMMNQQRMNGGDGYGGGMYQPQPMMYGRQPMGVGYAPPMVPTPGHHDPYTSYFSDENPDSCSIM